MKKNLVFLILIILSLLLVLGCESDKSIYVGDDISVALVIGRVGDMSFNDTAIIGLNMAREDYDINLEIFEHENKPENYEAKLIEAAENRNQIIMASSFLAEAIEKNAEKYPNITFILYDGEIDWSKGDFENVVCVQYKSNEASFLAGYAAASLSDSEVIGVLAGMDIPINNDFIIGYIQGAKLYNPEIRVIVKYVGSFENPEKGKALSKEIIEKGADVLFNVAGGSGEGLLEAVQEEGKLAIGVDTDQAMLYESKGEKEIANVIFTSVLKRVDHTLYEAVELYHEQKLNYGKTEKLGLKEEAVGLAKNDYYEKYLDKDTRVEIEELREKIISEEIIVHSVWHKDEEFIKNFIDSVRP